MFDYVQFVIYVNRAPKSISKANITMPPMNIWAKQDPPANSPVKQPPRAPSLSSDIAPKMAPPTAKITSTQNHIYSK